MLSSTGLVLLFRLNIYYGIHQLAWTAIGLAAVILMISIRNYQFIFIYKYYFIAVGIISLLLPLIFGVEIGGARSWLNLGHFYLQPSEFVKILLIVFGAAYFAEKGELNQKNKIQSNNIDDMLFLGGWLLFPGLLVLQKDLGMAVIYFAVIGALFYIVTGKWTYIAGETVLFLLAGIISYIFFPRVSTRVEIWLNPFQANLIKDSSYQIIQSLSAISNGGLFGSGLGAGSPGSIPAVHTDFIYAAICEEMGLAGGAGVVFLYMILFYRGFSIALNSKDRFFTILAAGITAAWGIQAIVILAGVIKILPLTGVTLPFISYGGSSLVANFLLIGILMNISHRTGDFCE
ncbi:MAG: FtsW/RodA/SpoVE family cell cycle protein [Clostridiales bacterium]|nr:FtsW/RodA/SpoVE family cell cycle protein [Clostridiales bacterium]